MMSSTCTITECDSVPSLTAFEMERGGSETSPSIGRSQHRRPVGLFDDELGISPFEHDYITPEGNLLEAGNSDVDISKDFAEGSASAQAAAMLQTPSPSSAARKVELAHELDKIDTVTSVRDVHGRPPAKDKRKKKKKHKKQAPVKAEPAMQVIRGFTPTRLPPTIVDSQSWPIKTQVRDLSVNTSLCSSPLTRPVSRAGSAIGGITALRQQLDALQLDVSSGDTGSICSESEVRSSPPSTPGITNGSGTTSDVEPPEMESYEVPLETDFVSQEMDDQMFDPLSPQFDIESIHRKMTAKDFTPLTCLGKGSFGTVHLVKQAKTGQLFAQKMFRKASITVQKTLIEQTKTERAILESVNRHPFIVKLYYAFQDQEKLYLILEYAQGGELFTYLAQQHLFPEATASFYMAEMVLALEHLHKDGIVYRDLKPENCLLDADGHLLLTDFGLSKVALDDVCTSFLGTIEYMAPEIIQGQSYDQAVDWWSFGALAYDLLTGSPPFTANNKAKVQEKIVRAKPSLPYYLSNDAKELLLRFLRKSPSARLGGTMPRDMAVIKRHRFFRKIDWKKLERRELDPPIRPLVTDPELAENFASEFTNLPLSPSMTTAGDSVGVRIAQQDGYDIESEEINPFGGFSFVASKSLLASEGFLGAMMNMEE